MALRLLAPARLPAPRHLRRERLRLSDGARTTLHIAEHPFGTRVGVHRFAAEPLADWCRRTGHAEAIVGGFFLRGERSIVPLGEVRTRGIERRAIPFDAPYDAIRACVHADGHVVRLARRDALPSAPSGDLLQAGPLLLDGGQPCLEGDAEGFSAGSHQFDSDITEGRHPRAALGLKRDGRLLAVACDGRSEDEAGLTLGELAGALLALGAMQALNLDGGGSTSLVCGGRLRNLPREQHGVALGGGRPISTALTFTRR
jgi:hypothetical protein